MDPAGFLRYGKRLLRCTPLSELTLVDVGSSAGRVALSPLFSNLDTLWLYAGWSNPRATERRSSTRNTLLA